MNSMITPNVSNGYIVECVIPFDFETTNGFQTKEIVEDLVPPIIIKLYRGSVAELNHTIYANCITVKGISNGSGDWELDEIKESRMVDTALALERYLYSYGMHKDLHTLMLTHVPIRAKILSPNGLKLICQNMNISKNSTPY